LWFGAQFTGDVAVASDWSATEIAILAGTATLGVVVQSVALFSFLGRAGIRFRLDFRFRGVGLGTATKLAAWTFGMIIVTQLAGVVQSNIASLATAYDEPGLAVLRFSWLFFMLPHSVITVSLGTVYFTRMSTAIRDGRWDRLGHDLSESLSRISMFMVISSAVLWMSAADVAGVFAEQTGAGMASVIAYFGIGLIPFGIAYVLQRIFFALEDTRTPFFIQLFQSGIFVVGALWVGTGPVENIADGIALSMSASILFQAIVLAVLLRRRLDTLGGRALAFSFLRFLGAVVPALGVGFVIRNALPDAGGSVLSSIAFATLIGLGMGLVYQLTLLVFRDPSAAALVAPLRRRGNKQP